MSIEIKNNTLIIDPNGTIHIKLLYNDWCGYCQKILPLWDELSEQYKDKYSFTKVECTKEREHCSKYTIQGVPTIFKESDGNIVDTLVGYRNKEILEEFITKEHK